MRQIREVLRLHLQGGRSFAECGRALGIAKSTAAKFVLLARAAGVDWALAQQLTDEQLESRLYRPPVVRASHQLEPNFALVHQELKRAGVTLQLLWEEYAKGNDLAFKYTSFCVKYRAWKTTLARSMRQVHVAGERLFVDYAGQTVPIVDPGSGEVSYAQIFVAVLGASNYTYACATLRQSMVDWVGAIVAALEFIGGVPVLLVPDQPRALIAIRAATIHRPIGRSKSLLRTTAWRCYRRGPDTRAINPRSRPVCSWWSVGFRRGCATGAS
jgi:transposase